MTTATHITLKIMVDLILYNRLGENPTREEISKLLDEYKLEQEKLEESLEQNKLLVCRLIEALDGGDVYTEGHRKFCEETREIMKQYSIGCQGGEP